MKLDSSSGSWGSFFSSLFQVDLSVDETAHSTRVKMVQNQMKNVTLLARKCLNFPDGRKICVRCVM
jgi:hypothetical protein